jgi:hypothetical protein
MRRLIDEVVLDDDERALSSTMPALPDPRQAARAVYDAVAGCGPLQRHLDDPDVEELWVNGRLTGGWAGTGVARRVHVPQRPDADAALSRRRRSSRAGGAVHPSCPTSSQVRQVWSVLSVRFVPCSERSRRQPR